MDSNCGVQGALRFAMCKSASRTTVIRGENSMTAETTSTTQIDWDAFRTWEAEQRREKEDRVRDARAKLLVLLRNANVTGIEALYDGYGDSGNVSEVSAAPEGTSISEVDECLRDFVWDIASMLHPGFEIDDGGEGTFTWDVTKDRINLDHADFLMERIPELHEDI